MKKTNKKSYRSNGRSKEKTLSASAKASGSVKGKSRKKIIIIAIISVLAVLTVTAVSVFAWYKTTALPTALKIGDAVSAGDGEMLFEYVEPSEKRTIKLGMTLLGITEDGALKIALGFNKNSTPPSVDKVKLLSYEQSDDSAELLVLLTFEDGSKKEMALNFVKTDGEWYLSIKGLLGNLFSSSNE